MPFSNPIVGGTALVRPAINSPDYQLGVQGWSINADGTAEFNSVLVRGELDVTSPNPAQQVIVANLTGDTGPRIEILADGSIRWGNGSPAVGPSLYLDPGVGLAAPFLAYDNNGTPEVWNALALQSGWTNLGGTDITGQYRFVPSPAKTVHIVGTLAAGTKADGTPIFTLPAGYQAAHDQIFPITANGLDTTLMAQLQIAGGTGVATIAGVSAAGITHISLGSILLALDA